MRRMFGVVAALCSAAAAFGSDLSFTSSIPGTFIDISATGTPLALPALWFPLLLVDLVLLTLGLFMLVINGLLLGLTSSLGRAIGIPFYVDGFGAAFVGGIVISLVSLLATIAFRDSRR